jgi:NitT/TauT family transport system substrate-binding protein
VVVAATEAFMAAQPKGVTDIVRLAIRAREMILSDPKGAAPHIGAAISGGLVDNAIFERALGSKAITFVVDPRTIVDATRDSLAFEVEIGDFATAPSIDGLFDHSWYERAVAR